MSETREGCEVWLVAGETPASAIRRGQIEAHVQRADRLYAQDGEFQCLHNVDVFDWGSDETDRCTGHDTCNAMSETREGCEVWLVFRY
jgi:hypothetical protein